jgi:glycolate oxidase FAD binding subunit
MSAALPAPHPVLRPSTDLEVVAMVADAIAAKTSLDIVGGGTRSGLGRPQTGDHTMSLDALTGITLYEPAELVIGARAGTTLAEIERTLAERGQMLPFEPMDHRALYGTTGEPNIAGVFTANISGPRRLSSGAARDHLLGVTLVNGRAQLVKNGGRVMKNVTGLDLVKLSGGAMGTLGVLTEVILKVLPAPEFIATLVFEGLGIEQAVALMSRSMGSPFNVAAAAHIPGWSGGTHRTLLRVEGFQSSVRYRLDALACLLSEFGAGSIIEPEATVPLWRSIRDVQILAAPADFEIWRAVVAPSKAPDAIAALAGNPGIRYFLDWAGGLIWIAAPVDANLERDFRAVVDQAAGHVTLIRASDERRRTVPVYQPLAAPLMTLTRGLKHSFDPDCVFNPGRMYEGI